MTRTLPAILLSFALACGGGAAEGNKVDQAITIAKELRAKPDDAEKILGVHKLTEDQWEALIYEIASDPALAEKFEAGVKK
jgi:hypothetical protein